MNAFIYRSPARYVVHAISPAFRRLGKPPVAAGPAGTDAPNVNSTPNSVQDFIARTAFADLPALVARHAQLNPQRAALVDPVEQLDWAGLQGLADRVAAALQRDGLQPGDAIAACALSSVRYAALFIGALRTGVVMVPLAPSLAPAGLARMVADAQVRCLFVDMPSLASCAEAAVPQRVAIDDQFDAGTPWSAWLAPPDNVPKPVALQPSMPLNIIYSSGTTGDPKGIVQSHGMRWAHIRRGLRYGYGPQARTLLSTPLYSNTTLVTFFPTLAFGGCAVLMPKFDAAEYLALAERERITHTMLVPVQYRRLLAHEDFDGRDLSSFRMKFCTSAPFPAAVKAEALRRWPGGLVEFYGMTEGGGTCILEAHLHPHKLHTVGKPAEGSDIRLIDDAGHECAPGAVGEVVGHSAGMMTGYHAKPEATREAEWFAPDGKRFIRTGDIGRFDADGFLTLLDRKKDLIISGGFNLYPSDLEAALQQHPAVAEAAVVGVPSDAWGETPVGFVVARAGQTIDTAVLLAWVNARLGKTQRLSLLHAVDELPRNAIGKVLKRELRERHLQGGGDDALRTAPAPGR